MSIILDSIFEICWEEYEGKKFRYPSRLTVVKIKLVPVKEKTWQDILDWYVTENMIRESEMRMFESKSKNKKTKKIELHLNNPYRYDTLTLDRGDGIFYHVIAGAHYITQHWRDILPDNYFDLISEASSPCNENKPTLQFKTLNHSTLDIPLYLIIEYFVRGYEGEMNHNKLGDIFYEMLNKNKT